MKLVRDAKRGHAEPRREDPARSPDPDLVEYLVMTTAGLPAAAAVAPALREFVRTSQIRILDLVAVQTDALGGYTAIEPEALPGLAELRGGDRTAGGVLSEDDIALACGAIGPNASALILVAEDSWAQVLADAARAGGGRIVGGERIPRHSIEQSQRQRSREDDGSLPRPPPRASRRHLVDLLRRRPVLDGRVAGS